jgi:hypothetical protein
MQRFFGKPREVSSEQEEIDNLLDIIRKLNEIEDEYTEDGKLLTAEHIIADQVIKAITILKEKMKQASKLKKEEGDKVVPYIKSAGLDLSASLKRYYDSYWTDIVDPEESGYEKCKKIHDNMKNLSDSLSQFFDKIIQKKSLTDTGRVELLFYKTELIEICQSFFVTPESVEVTSSSRKLP